MKLFPCYLTKITKEQGGLAVSMFGGGWIPPYYIDCKEEKKNCGVKHALSLLRGLITGELSTHLLKQQTSF